ncbi:MAG: polyprenyl diphosphate synthase [Candidatus Odinarchaeota archaeon]
MVDLLSPIYKIYKWKLWRQIKNGEMPQHIGVILDGNRRYARERGLNPLLGHRIGAEKVRDFLKWCWHLNIQVVTLYALSVENLQRDREEVEHIFEIAREKFQELLTDPSIKKNQVRVRALGRRELLSKTLLPVIEEAERTTENYNKHFLNIALGYSGRGELTDALRKISDQITKGVLKPADITEDLISKHLYTAGLPDPDLIIRTSGEERLSNFLLWQSAYSELYFCDVYWPEVREIDLWRAIRIYQKRKRRFGK